MNDARIAARAAALAHTHAKVAHEVARRGADAPSLFVALASALGTGRKRRSPPPLAPIAVVNAGHAFFVRYDPGEREGIIAGGFTFAPVAGVFRALTGLPLFAQLLENGAVPALGGGALADADVQAVLEVFELAGAGHVVRSDEDLAHVLAMGESEHAAVAGGVALAELIDQWEPPHVDGRALRLCFDDRRGTFGACVVDLVTCAVVAERRGRAPIAGAAFREGRAYIGVCGAAVTSFVVAGRSG